MSSNLITMGKSRKRHLAYYRSMYISETILVNKLYNFTNARNEK